MRRIIIERGDILLLYKLQKLPVLNLILELKRLTKQEKLSTKLLFSLELSKKKKKLQQIEVIIFLLHLTLDRFL